MADNYPGGNQYAPPGGSRPKRKDGPPIVIFIFLGLIAALAAAVFVLFRPEPGSGRTERFGGAKIKKQTIWDNGSVKVEALKLDVNSALRAWSPFILIFVLILIQVLIQVFIKILIRVFFRLL